MLARIVFEAPPRAFRSGVGKPGGVFVERGVPLGRSVCWGLSVVLGFKSYYDLSRDIAGAIAKIPSGIDIVVGVPKSGLIPASIIASFLNVQLIDLDSFLFSYSSRAGHRPVRVQDVRRQRVLIVDDSVNTGTEFKRVRQRLQSLGDQFDYVFCAIYGANPEGHADVADVVLSCLPQPRVFQWNYRNHVVAEHACFDMDGVLCVDPTDEQNDDGEKYIDFILNAAPLFIPQRRLSSIVTSRLEKFRAETEAWLAAHGVKYGELIMLDLPSAAERRRLKAHAPFKAEVYSGRSEILFVESNWKQARHIAEHADKPVICTENDAFLYGKDHLASLQQANQLFSYERLDNEQALRAQVKVLTERLQRLEPGLQAVDSKGRPVSRWHTERLLNRILGEAPAAPASPRGKTSARRVLLISTTFDKRRGAGAAASSVRLRDSLAGIGMDVVTLSSEDFAGGRQTGVDQPISGQTLAFWNSYHDPAHAEDLRSRVAELNPDVILLGAVDRGILSLFDIAKLDYPILWVGRDNWSHTGGCLFQLDANDVAVSPGEGRAFFEALTCGQYRDGCNACPAIRDPRESAKAKLQYELKRAVLTYRKDIVFAPISDWLAGVMRAAPLTREHRIERVYNPIDLSVVRPLPVARDELRKQLGLPLDKKVVLVAAHSLTNPRKGIGLVYRALEASNRLDDALFVQVGTDNHSGVPESLRSRFRPLGFIDDEARMVALYNAVDATLVPALQETLSVVASDSLCCGTPVVAFRTSGLTDLVDHKKNGYLAQPFEASDLLDGLDWVLRQKPSKKLRENARRTAAEMFDPARAVDGYEKLIDAAILAHAKLGPVPAEIETLETAFALLSGDLGFRHMHMRTQASRLRPKAGAAPKAERAPQMPANDVKSDGERRAVRSLKTVYAAGRQLFLAGEHEKALAIFEGMIRERPDTSLARLAAAECHLALDAAPAATALVREAATLNPGSKHISRRLEQMISGAELAAKAPCDWK